MLVDGFYCSPSLRVDNEAAVALDELRPLETRVAEACARQVADALAQRLLAEAARREEYKQRRAEDGARRWVEILGVGPDGDFGPIVGQALWGSGDV